MRYSPLILEHVKYPRNVGELSNPDAIARVRSSADGDILQLHLKIQDGRVAEARFKVFGCGAAIATGSILTELVIGKSVEELEQITNEDIAAILGGLPPEKIHCSVLAEQAIREAMQSWSDRNQI
jgi:nitrogen fixation NifU-like protein